MVGTIGFAGSKAREGNRIGRWLLRIGGPHVLASGLGGLTLGLVAGTLGSLLGELGLRPPYVAIAAVLGGLALVDAVGIPAHHLGRARQVRLSWRHAFPAPMSATLYGATLGFGLATAAHFWSFWGMLVAVVALQDPFAGAAVGLAFGLGRSVPVALSASMNLSSMQELFGRLDRHRPLLRQVSAAATALCALSVLAGGSWTPLK